MAPAASKEEGVTTTRRCPRLLPPPLVVLIVVIVFDATSFLPAVAPINHWILPPLGNTPVGAAEIAEEEYLQRRVAAPPSAVGTNGSGSRSHGLDLEWRTTQPSQDYDGSGRRRSVVLILAFFTSDCG
jgi:hypothetical protein